MIKGRILVVEDERIVALSLRQQLTKLGYEVPAMAASGDAALRQIEALRPDLVLMDIRIEGDIDGIETAARIPGELAVPVIYLSAYSEEVTLDRARATTPYGYLLKPFSERELHATIQMVLERRRVDLALRQNERQLAQLIARRTEELRDQTTERLKAERALHHAQKMEAVGQLTGGLAHDFNNLLTAIAGCLDLVQKYTDDRRVDRLLDTARLAATRGQKLISQLIAFSRRQVLRPRVSQVNPLIAVFDDLWRQACGESVTFEVKLEDGLGTANIDPAQLQSSILNLVVNARDAMPNGGQLAIETTNAEIQRSIDITGASIPPGHYVVVSVRDTGRGMAPAVLDKAIEPFFTTKEVGKGSGLGLSQVYGFVRQSGGYLQIDSEPGRGTTVHLLLPRAESAAPAPGPNTAPGKPAVLIVEDDPAVLEVAVEMLAESGYQIYTAEDGAHAMELLRTDIPIDVLFTDIVMPQGVNGVQLAERVRKLRPDIRVLLTSGYPRDALEDQQGLRQDQEFLSKPYRATTLIDAINRAMKRAF